MRLSWSRAETLRSTNSPILRVDLAHLFRDFAGKILVDLEDLQLKFGDFSFGLRGRGDQLPALTAKARCLAFELAQPRDWHEILLKEIANASELVLDKGDFLFFRGLLRGKADDFFVALG